MPLARISDASSRWAARATASRAIGLSNGGLVVLSMSSPTSAKSSDSARLTCWASSRARISSIVSAPVLDEMWNPSSSPDLSALTRCCCSGMGRNSMASR